MPATLKEHLESLTVRPNFEWGITSGTPSRLRKQPYVYFVQNEDGFIKIGFTRHIKSRLVRMQIDNCMKVKLIGKMKGGRDLEMKLHRKFKQYRKRGEWFVAVPELLEYISTHKLYKGKSLG